LRRRAFTRPRPCLIVFLTAVSILPGLGVDDADAGNPVALAQLAVDCPDGGRERGDGPPRGYARWCEKSGPFGVQRHGPYATWHPSGAMKEEGEYRDGRQHGRWTVWTAQGGKESEGEYRNGLKHGRWTTWERGERTEGEYQYGLREGVWTTWSSSGVTLAEGPYVYGRKQGLWTQWNPDGSKQEEAEFLADQRHGRFIRYSAGIKASETTYRHNVPNGHVTMWHRNGQKSGEADLRDGHPTGAFTAWHPTGLKMGEGQYTADRGPDGDFTFWDPQGRRRVVFRFMNGALVALLAWDEHGRAIANAVEVRQHRDAYFDGHPNDFLMFLAILGGRGR